MIEIEAAREGAGSGTDVRELRMDTNAAIECHGIERSFKRVAVLRGLDLAVPAGTTYGLLGRNGAGKTTLIQILLGIGTRDRGEASVLGHDPAGRDGAVVRARSGYVPERPALYAHMRVREQIAFARSLYPSWSGEEERRLTDWLKIATEKRVGLLSKGGQAKLSLLLALAHEPDVLFLDEPTSGLDPLVKDEVLEAVVDLVARSGRTVFWSSHQLDELERVVDRVGILAQGTIRAEGTLDELRGRVHEVRLRFPGDAPPLGHLSWVLDARSIGREAVLLVESPLEAAQEQLRTRFGAVAVETAPADLKRIFQAYAGKEEV